MAKRGYTGTDEQLVSKLEKQVESAFKRGEISDRTREGFIQGTGGELDGARDGKFAKGGTETPAEGGLTGEDFIFERITDPSVLAMRIELSQKAGLWKT